MDEFWKCQIRCRETILDQIGFLNMNDFEILDLYYTEYLERALTSVLKADWPTYNGGFHRMKLNS